MTPTPEQEAIIASACTPDLNIMIQAFAGCAKSSTLTMICKKINPIPLIIVVFNRKNKLELEKLVPAWVQVKTLNGLGHQAWSKTIGRRCEPDDRKLGKLVTSLAREWGLELTMDQWSAVRQLVSAAMTAGLIPKAADFPLQMDLGRKGLVPDTEESWAAIADDNWIEIDPDLHRFARAILIESIKMAYQGAISFDDQIYCSAMLGGVFPQVPFLMVDEAQDLSPLNHIQVRKTAKGRIIAVGDHHQAIYGWRGASHDSMNQIRALRPEWRDHQLSVTFRCPQSHVARAASHAIGFKAFASNPAGQIWDFRHALPPKPDAEPRPVTRDDLQGLHWTWDYVERLAAGRPITILCRNNAPLLSMAFKLIRRGKGCQMLGRDIGKGLKALSEKILPDDKTPAPDCVRLIAAWADSQIALARANENLAKVDKITDQTECLQAVLESAEPKDAKALRAAIEALFDRTTGLVTLSTGHKFKGMECPVVIHLDPWRIPSKWAQEAARQGDDRTLVQEWNLNYVVETRSKDVLILANKDDFR